MRNRRAGSRTISDDCQHTVVMYCYGWNTSNTKEPCLSTLLNTEKKAEDTTLSGVFLTNFQVFGNVFNHCFEFLI